MMEAEVKADIVIDVVSHRDHTTKTKLQRKAIIIEQECEHPFWFNSTFHWWEYT